MITLEGFIYGAILLAFLWLVKVTTNIDLFDLFSPRIVALLMAVSAFVAGRITAS